MLNFEAETTLVSFKSELAASQKLPSCCSFGVVSFVNESARSNKSLGFNADLKHELQKKILELGRNKVIRVCYKLTLIIG